jgi:2-polyprenyl-3-methyl-5-hydroxy-6-metoxy-1,4-benzoquinol methylase
MYDTGKGSWSEVCAAYDQEVDKLGKTVGGIEYLGELGKAALYQAISEAAVMWYPGVPHFAETSCLASIESQACGTPFVGSFKGALPESVPHGILIEGDAYSPEYQVQSVGAVLALMKGCKDSGFDYRRRAKAGIEHVTGYTFDVIAGEWETWIEQTFRERYAAHKPQVLAELMHFDDHVAGKVVAREIGDTAAEAFCDRVIQGLEHSAEQYSEHAFDTITEMRHPGHNRIRIVSDAFDGCAYVLDVACGNGSFALSMAEAHPTLRVLGIDYAAENIKRAQRAAEELGLADRVTFRCMPIWDFAVDAFSAEWRAFVAETGRQFDGLWCGEFVEHVADCTSLIDGLEAVLLPDAKVLYTCPSGPMTEYQGRTFPTHKGHVHHFAFDDLNAVWGPKDRSTFDLMLWPNPTPTGALCGNWIIAYRASDKQAGQRNLEHRIVTTRPRARLSVGILALNAEHDILKCIDSVWGIADEILVGDTGSTDTTKAIVAGMRKVRVLDVTSVQQHPDGFAGARNEVLAAATGDRFLWIDTDEVLVGSTASRKYLDSVVYRGFALYQNHLQLDAPMHHDSPVRIFSREPDIQFYGCVHEQPQAGDCNGDIVPALQLSDVQLAHTGYLVEGIRRQKMAARNFPLLIQDQQRFPDRKLGKVLVLRDLVNLADYAAEEAGYQYPPQAIDYLRRAVAMFEQVLGDPSNRFHSLARPYYERALKALGIGIEVEMSLGCKPGGLNGERPKARRVWVRQPDDLKRLMDWQVDDIVGKLKPPPLRVEPLDSRQAVSA